MSKFVRFDVPTTHAGAERLENAVSFITSRRFSLHGSRSLAAMLVAAAVAGLMVLANELIETITDGHLFAAWIGLWAVGFAAMSLLSQPAFAMAAALRRAWGQWREARRLAAQDEKIWELALNDARVMADIRAAASFPS